MFIVIPCGVSVFPFFLYYILYIYILVRNVGYYHHPYFKNPIFKSFFFKKESKKGKPRIEFSPANKKKKRTCSIPRIEFSPANKKEKRRCSNENFLRNKKNNLEYILCVSVAKRGDLETPTKSALLFFVRGEKRKTFFYFFLLGVKRVFTTH